MKKISLLLVAVLFTLTGCGQKTAYEQMVDDIGNIKVLQYVVLEVGANVEGVDLNYTVEMDSKAPLVHISFLGQELYLSDSSLYIHALGNWFSSELTEEQIADLEEEFNFNFFTIDMPAGDDVINIDTGVSTIDDAVNGKTFNEVVVATDTGFTIAGLEENLAVTAADQQLSLEFSDSASEDSAHITLGKTEKFELPAEAADAKAIPASALSDL